MTGSGFAMQFDREIEIARETSDSWIVRTKGGRYLRANAAAVAIIGSMARGAPPPRGRSEAEVAIIDAVFGGAARERRVHASIKGKIELLSPGRTARIAHALKWVFSAMPGVLIVVALAVASAIVLYLQMGASLRMSGSAYALIGVLVIASSLVHELGHASALASFGRRPDAIGFGFFIYVLPCFFADVSESWLLGQRERIIVSAAGSAFQAIFGLVVLLVGVLPGSGQVTGLCIEAAQLILMAALFQLIPFHMSDGHWILRDMLTKTSDPKAGLLARATTGVGVFFLAMILYKALMAWWGLAMDIAFFLDTGYAPNGIYSMQTVYALLAVVMLGVVSARTVATVLAKRSGTAN